MTSGCKFLAAFGLGLYSLASWGQTPQLSQGVPDESFLGEQFCFETSFTNLGDPGFGPYVRLQLPPELAFDSASVFGAAIGGSVELIGTFPDEAPSELNDPRIDQAVAGTPGYSLRIIGFPVGSVVEGAPELPLELCLTIGQDAAVGEALPIDLTPVYQFGDTPTGDNGPIVGDEVEQTVTPTVLLFEKSDDAPEGERPPGTTWPYSYTLTVDIANTATISLITIADTLPGDFLYDGQGIDITGGQGCSVTKTPPTSTPGGDLKVTCAGDTVGTTSGSDIQVQYSGYIVDVLDEAACSTAPLNNTAVVDATYVDQDNASNVLPGISSNATVTAKHVAVQKGASPGSARPGATVTYALDLQVTDFGDVSALTLTDTLPDGVDFVDGTVAVEVGGTSVTVKPVVTINTSSGETTVVLDIGSAYFSQHSATQIDAGTAISVGYDAVILQTYRETGEPVRASDSLPNTVDVTYGLVQGAGGCSDASAAAVGILPVALDKAIVDQQAFYAPGDPVQFRLTLDVPSGDTRDIRFEDFLPLPVFDVGDLDLTFGGPDLVRGPGDTADLTPGSISINAAQNALFIDWPDLVSQDVKIIQIDLFATVTDDPFADELSLTNILLAETSNTPGQVGVDTGPINFQVRAPVLEIGKAVSDSSNTGSTIDADGNLDDADAGDEVTFEITLANAGGADAYDATISDPPPAGLENCQGPTVMAAGSTRTFTGDLFDSDNPLVIGGVIAADESAVITYRCTVASEVDPREILVNEATATWAAGAGAPPLPAIRDDASVTIAGPAIEKTSTAVVPGPDADGVVPGDTITYQLTVTLPEGTTPGLTIEDQLPAGFGFVTDSVAVDASGLTGTVNTSPTASQSGQTITLDFGDTTATGSTGSAYNSFLVTYEAEVLDDDANAAASSPQGKTNRVSLNFTDNPSDPVTDSHDLDFREPDLAITKAFSPAGPFQAGEEITITLEVENTGTAPAFDILVTDQLNEGTDNKLLDLNTVAEGTTPSGYVSNFPLGSGDTLTYSSNDGVSLPAGDAVSFTFIAKVRDDVVTGSRFENTADVDWDSQDGEVDNERSGTNDDTAEAEVDSPAVSKTISATSEAWTTGSNLAIGEIVSYQVTYTIPQGQTLSATPAILTDTLPAGQRFLRETATIQGVYDSTDGLSGSSFGTIPSDETAIVPALDGQQLQFDLGDLQNDDADENDERIIIRFDALVLNISDNNRGDQKNNTAHLNFLNRSGNAQSQQDTQDVTIVESNLSVDKTADPTSASGGESIEFTAVVGNPDGGSITRAWELELDDVLPGRYQNPTLTSVTLSRGGTDLLPCASVSGQTIGLDLDCLDAGERYLGPGETIELIYSATLDPAVEFEEVVTNAASAQATSLPGDKGTGNVVPGDPGGDTGERTGSGDPNESEQSVNDLAAMNSASVTADRPTVTKTVADGALQIGETTEVTLTIAVPVGQTDAFVLTDSLPAGLEYLDDAEITLPDQAFTATNNPTNPGAGANTLTFDFGDVQNIADATQNIVIAYSVQVLDVEGNSRGTTLTNTADLSYEGVDTDDPPTDDATVRVLEPALALEKAITAGAAGSTAGDAVAYQLTVSNTDAEATAYRVDLRDLLPPELLGGTPTFANVALNNENGVVLNSDNDMLLTAADAEIATTANAGDTLTWPLFDMPPGASLTLSYEAVVVDDALVGAELTNTVDTGYDSLPDGGGRDYASDTDRTLTLDAVIALQKTLSEGQGDAGFTIGEKLQFELRVDLLEGVTDSVQVVDRLPAGLSFVALDSIEAASNIDYDGPGTAVDNPGGTVSVDLGRVTNTADDDEQNDFLILRLTARVDNVEGNQNGDELTNKAEVTSAIGEASDTLPVTVVEPVLEVVKQAQTATPSLGNAVTYTVTVRHTGESKSDAFDVALADLIPDGLSYVPGSATGPVTADATGLPEVAFDLGTITLSEGEKEFSYQATVDLGAEIGAPLTNGLSGAYASLADASGAEDSGRTGPLESDDTLNDYTMSGEETVTVGADRFLLPVKTVELSDDVAGNSQVDPSDTLEYRIVLTNQGEKTATGVVFTDPIPASSSYVAGSSRLDGVDTGSVTDGVLTVAIGELASGESVTIRFQVTVNAGTPAGTLISNQGLVDSEQTVPTPSDADGLPENGFQPTDVPVGGQPPLGSPLTAEKRVTLVEDVGDNGAVNPGDGLRYSLVLSNLGDETLTNVELSDGIPAGLSYVSGSAQHQKGTVTVSDRALEWTGLSLEPGTFTILTFEVTVDTPLFNSDDNLDTETFTNQGVIDSDQTSPGLTDSNGDPSDGFQPTTIDATTGDGEPQLDVQKRWALVQDFNGNGLANPGDELGYGIRITNSGSAATRNARMRDEIPDSTSLVPGSVTADRGVVTATDPITVNLGSLAPGEVATVRFRVRIDAGVADGTLVANQGVLTGDNFAEEPSDDNGDPHDGRNPTLTPVDNPDDPNPGPGPGPAQPGDLTKQLSATSEGGSSSNNDVLIGEVLTFDISVDVPVGTLREAALGDRLPEGLGYVAGTAQLSRTFDTGLSASQNPGGINGAESGAFVPLADGIELQRDGQILRVFLGDVINSDQEPATYLLQFQAVVQNTAGNQAGTTLANIATLNYFDALNQPVQLSPVGVEAKVTEPNVSIAKAAEPMTLLPGGGTVTYTVVLRNADDAAPAYDARITDSIPEGWDLIGVELGSSGGAEYVVDNSNLANDQLGVAIGQLPAGASVTVTYRVTAPSGLAVGSSTPNTAEAAWTSLPGEKGTDDATPGAPGEEGGERTGSGDGANDFNQSDTAQVLIGQPALSKAVLEEQPRYAIGDEVRYELRLSVPAGAVLDTAELSDRLADGLEYLSDSLSLELDGLGADRTPDDFTEAPDGDGALLTADFGTLRNPHGDSRTLVASYRARVANQLSNQDGQSLANTATFGFTDPGTGEPATPLAAEDAVTVGEPILALDKAIVGNTADLDAGDSVTFEVVVGNTGTRTAYDVVLDDVLPAGLTGLAGLTRVDERSDVEPELAPAGDAWSSSAFDLAVGNQVVVRFSAILDDGVFPGETLQNRVDASFSSRPGDDLNQRDGSDDGLQDDANVLNNYNAEGRSPTVTVADRVQLDKRFYPEATDDRYAIGETVTYRLRVDLIEGAVDEITVVDTLPDGLLFVAAEVGLGNTGMSTAQPIGPDDQPSAVDGQELAFTLGQVENPPNSASDDDFLTIDIRARVENIPANEDGVVLGNDAELSFRDADGALVQRSFDADADEPDIQPLDLTIVEPALALSKTADRNAVSLGDEVRFTLSVDHSVASTADGFDLVIEDRLPAGLSYVPDSASPEPTTVDGQTLRWERASLTLTEDSTTIDYLARVESAAAAGQPLTNDAALRYASQPGATGSKNSGRTGPLDPEDALNDYADEAAFSVSPTLDAFLYPVKTVELVGDLASNGQVDPGDRLEYMILLTNQGDETATGVVFTDPIPADTSYVGGSLTSTRGSVDDSADPLVVDIGELEGDATVTIHFQVEVDAPLPPGVIISNQGSVDSEQTVPTPSDADGIRENGAQPTDVPVGGSPSPADDLQISLTASCNDGDAPVVAYEITGEVEQGSEAMLSWIKEDGTGEVVQVLSNEPLTGELLWPGAEIDTDGNATNWPGWDFDGSNWAQVDDGLRPLMRIRAAIDGRSAEAVVSYPSTDCNPPGASPEPLLSLAKSIALIGDTNSDQEINPGERVRYTLLIRNSGSGVARDVRVEDDLSGLNGTPVLGTATTSQGVIEAFGSGLVVNVGDLAPGVVTVRFDVTAGDPGALENTATAEDADGNSGSDAVSEEIVVFEPFDPPTGRKVVNAAGLPELEWTMVWLNPDQVYVSPIRVVDPIPANSDFVPGSLDCIANGASSETRCEFDAARNEVVFEGFIAPDPGATGLEDSSNAIVIRFRVTVQNLAQEVVNQGFAQWDEDGDGALDPDQKPTGDPDSSDEDGPTGWPGLPPNPTPVPTLSEWVVLLLMLALAGLAIRHLRRLKRRDDLERARSRRRSLRLAEQE